MSYHQTIVVGNLGSDPEKRAVGNTTVTNFSLAVSESWTDANTNERREKTTWYRVNAWGKQGDIAAQYLAKGRQVMVIGTVEASAYMGQDGQPRASLELRAQTIRFLGGGNSADSGQSSQGAAGHAPPPPNGEDIPF